MTNDQLRLLEKWFDEYYETFISNDADVVKNVKLKKEHTDRVRAAILEIGTTLKLSENDLKIAEIMALFHDIGRFEQFRKYRTFVDLLSVNHAELGVSILKKYQPMRDIDKEERELILAAIQNHNRKEIPDNILPRELFFSKLLRDADKLDIWKVVTDYYLYKENEPNGAIELGLPDIPEFTDSAIKSLLDEKIVEVESVKTVNDFRLLLTGWIFDLNFLPTLKAAKARGYLEMIFDMLPKHHDIEMVKQTLDGYISRKLNENINELH